MNDEAARQGRPANTTSPAVESNTAAGREPTVEELVEWCRAVAAAAGLSWVHDLVLAELARLLQKAAA